jgi:hypothetical protein
MQPQRSRLWCESGTHTPVLAASLGGCCAARLALRSAVSLDGDRCRHLSRGVRLPARSRGPAPDHIGADRGYTEQAGAAIWLDGSPATEAPLAPPVTLAVPKIAAGRPLDSVIISPPPVDDFGTAPPANK